MSEPESTPPSNSGSQPSPLGEPLVDPNVSYDLEPVQAEAPRPIPPAPAPVRPNIPAPAVPVNAFIKPGLGSAQVIAIAGATVLVIAVVMAAIRAGSGGWWSHGLLTLYLGLLHAGTGAAAVGFVAYALGRDIGDVPLAAARMLLAVSLLLLTISAGLPLHPLVVYFCAIALYALTTLILFRWEISEWAGVASIHAILWFLMYLAAKLQVAVSATTALSAGAK